MVNNVLLEVSSLPMILPEAEINAAIDKILNAARDDPSLPAVDVAVTLADIMGRQSENYWTARSSGV